MTTPAQNSRYVQTATVPQSTSVIDLGPAGCVSTSTSTSRTLEDVRAESQVHAVGHQQLWDRTPGQVVAVRLNLDLRP